MERHRRAERPLTLRSSGLTDLEQVSRENASLGELVSPGLPSGSRRLRCAAKAFTASSARPVRASASAARSTGWTLTPYARLAA